MKNNKKTIDPEMLSKLIELHENTTYQEWQDDDLLSKLNCNMTVFGLAMERLGARGFDEPPHEVLSELSYFWGDLHYNLQIALEVLNMGGYVLRGSKYDPKEAGRIMYFRSLEGQLETWKEESK